MREGFAAKWILVAAATVSAAVIGFTVGCASYRPGAYQAPPPNNTPIPVRPPEINRKQIPDIKPPVFQPQKPTPIKPLAPATLAPSAFALRDADLGQLSQMLIADSYGHKREAFAAELINAAHSSIGTNSPAKNMILKQKIALRLHLEGALQEITGKLIEMVRTLKVATVIYGRSYG